MNPSASFFESTSSSPSIEDAITGTGTTTTNSQRGDLNNNNTEFTEQQNPSYYCQVLYSPQLCRIIVSHLIEDHHHQQQQQQQQQYSSSNGTNNHHPNPNRRHCQPWKLFVETPRRHYSLIVTESIHHIICEKYSSLSQFHLNQMMLDAVSSVSPTSRYAPSSSTTTTTTPNTNPSSLSFDLFFTEEDVECGDDVLVHHFSREELSSSSTKCVIQVQMASLYGIRMKFLFVLNQCHSCDKMHPSLSLQQESSSSSQQHQRNASMQQNLTGAQDNMATAYSTPLWVIDGLRRQMQYLQQEKDKDSIKIGKLNKKVNRMQKELSRCHREISELKAYFANFNNHLQLSAAAAASASMKESHNHNNNKSPDAVIPRMRSSSSMSSMDSFPPSPPQQQQLSPNSSVTSHGNITPQDVDPTSPFSPVTSPSFSLEPGRSHFSNKYIEYIHGNSPFVLVCTHGGSQHPSWIKSRTKGKTKSDKQTIPLTLSIGQEILKKTGLHPSMVIMHLKRKKIDCNRPMKEGCVGEEAESLWKQFHALVKTAMRSACSNSSKVLLIDVHGMMGTGKSQVQLGYAISRDMLSHADSKLDRIQRSSISSFSKKPLSQVVRGEESLGSLLEKCACGQLEVTPSTRNPNAKGMGTYFSGGYITKTYCDSKTVSCVQLETSFGGIRDAAESREKFAVWFVEALLEWCRAHKSIQAEALKEK